MNQELLSLGQASEWATNYLERPVTPSSISYLIQYAKISKYSDEERKIKVNLVELKKYIDEHIIKKQDEWKKALGNDLNWALSFAHLREADTTKHVHRLHPYKGKFIPQLVEYFLDSHINKFKTEVYFKEGDIILDPFMGSGTTLVQCSELGLHSIGIDVSDFNCLISKVKLDKYDMQELSYVAKNNLYSTLSFSEKVFDNSFDFELKAKLNEFNNRFFPNPDIKRRFGRGEINEENYGEQKLRQFQKENEDFFRKNGTKDKAIRIDEPDMNSFLSKWFSKRVRQELSYYLKLIEQVEDNKIKNILMVILSRTARSCRATTHSDLATLIEPQTVPYYCRKHKKICSPVNTITIHLRRYTYDTISRFRVGSIYLTLHLVIVVKC